MILRAAQWTYDLALDLTGVCVGSYRRYCFVFLSISSDGLRGCFTHDADPIIMAIPLAWFIWFTVLRQGRLRAKLDDGDQSSGRFHSVNARALADRRGVLLVLPVAMCLAFCLLWFFEDSPIWAALGIAAVTSVAINECLLVRQRNISRFSRCRLSVAVTS